MRICLFEVDSGVKNVIEQLNTECLLQKHIVGNFDKEPETQKWHLM